MPKEKTLFLSASNIEALISFLDETELAMKRQIAMREILLTIGDIDVSLAVENRLKEPAFQALANAELTEFLESVRNVRKALGGEIASDAGTPQAPKPN